MDTKLTLKLDQRVIAKAKKYAQRKHISLSKLIERMLTRITDSKNVNTDITPLVESLSSLLSEQDIKTNDYIDYLDKKYR